MKKRVPKTLSIDPDTLGRGLERAAQFRLTFSRYVESLIEQDCETAPTRMVIVGEPRNPLR
jgi:hypothetical protein